MIKNFSALYAENEYIEMKTQSVDNFILFNIFGRENKISKLSISVGIRCKQGKGVLNWENGQSWS